MLWKVPFENPSYAPDTTFDERVQSAAKDAESLDAYISTAVVIHDALWLFGAPRASRSTPVGAWMTSSAP